MRGIGVDAGTPTPLIEGCHVPLHRPAPPAPPAGPLARFSPLANRAWRESPLRHFREQVVAELLVDAREVVLEPGSVYFSGSRHADTEVLALVVDGLVRAVITDSHGREMTIRYGGRGTVVGLPPVILGDSRGGGPSEEWLEAGGASLRGEALQRTTLLKLSPARFRNIASRHPDVAWASARYVIRETLAGQRLLAYGVFFPVRARVAQHLLHLAVRDGEALMVRVTHQDIANSIGTVREVVSRVLRALQDEGLVERDGQALRIVDPVALHAICARAMGDGD